MAVSLDVQDGDSTNSVVNNQTATITPGAGTNMILVAYSCTSRSGLNISQLRYDAGDTNIDCVIQEEIANGNNRAAIGDILDTDIIKSTLKTVTFTYSKTSRQSWHVTVFKDCDQTARLGGTLSTDVTEEDSALALTTTNGDAGVNCAVKQQSGDIVIGSGQTHITGSPKDDTNTFDSGASLELSVGATTTMSWSRTAATADWAHVAGMLTQLAAAGAALVGRSPIQAIHYLLRR